MYRRTGCCGVNSTNLSGPADSAMSHGRATVARPAPAVVLPRGTGRPRSHVPTTAERYPASRSTIASRLHRSRLLLSSYQSSCCAQSAHRRHTVHCHWCPQRGQRPRLENVFQTVPHASKKGSGGSQLSQPHRLETDVCQRHSGHRMRLNASSSKGRIASEGIWSSRPFARATAGPRRSRGTSACSSLIRNSFARFQRVPEMPGITRTIGNYEIPSK